MKVRVNGGGDGEGEGKRWRCGWMAEAMAKVRQIPTSDVERESGGEGESEVRELRFVLIRI